MQDLSGPSTPEIQLLGPVQISASATGDRARTLHSACAWLALHPNAAGCQIDRALQISAESRMSLLSRIRAWLGPDVLPTSKATGRYTLHLEADWDIVQRLVCTSTGVLCADPSPEALRTVLGMVRGEPLADVDACWADGVRIQMSLLIEDVAVLYARAAARDGRRREAAWAVGQGLIARPESEGLRSMLPVVVPVADSVGKQPLVRRKVCVGRRPRTIHHTSRIS